MALDDCLIELDIKSDRVNEYVQLRKTATRNGDIEWLDYLGDDEHQEMLGVIARHWSKLGRCKLSASLGGSYEDLLVKREAVEAIDLVIDNAINKAISREVERGYANENELEENPNDPRDETV